MKMKKRIIKGCAWALALLTAVSFLAARQDVAYGAKAVDENGDFRLILDFALNVNPNDQFSVDLKTDMDIPVKYYKVADMKLPMGTYKDTLTGPWTELSDVRYKVVPSKIKDGGFEVKVSGVDDDYKNYGDQTEQTADLEYVILGEGEQGRTDATHAWEALSKKAAAIVEEKKLGADIESVWKLAQSIEHQELIEDPGMYLIVAESVQSDHYTYHFKPYLISVPTNGYSDGVSGDNDEWVYQVRVGLKPEQEERYGRLRISKELTDFNSSLGAASFVFEVKAEKTVNNVNEVVYSDVVQLDFTGVGTQSVTIAPEADEGVDVVGKIPAGSKVTVTEVYSGASYTTDSREQTVETMQAYETEANVAAVSFTNHYNGDINGGSGVVNHFEYTESENGNGGNWKHVPSGSAEGGNTQ